MRSQNPQSQIRQVNDVIDAVLQQSTYIYWAEATRLRTVGTARVVAERVRRRGDRLARRNRNQRARIIEARDEFIQTIYAVATPHGWFTAWSDASVCADQRSAGLGGLLVDRKGRVIERVTRRVQAVGIFEAEIAALAEMLQIARTRGVNRLRVYSDCIALVKLWHRSRDDPRLAAVASLARDFQRLELQCVPRQHNQPAHRLAKYGAAQTR